MNQVKNIIVSQPLEFQITRPGACSYLDGHIEQRLAADISTHARHHDTLAEAGFRRVENWVYKPICQSCNACLPIRIPSGLGGAGQLQLSRTQRRIISRNADLSRNILPNFSHADHYDLFRRYLDSRHGDGQMADMNEEKYAEMISCSPIETVLVEYRPNDTPCDTLGDAPSDASSNAPVADAAPPVADAAPPVGVVMVDIQRDGLSAVYSFFDPALKNRSLGTFMVLDCAALALEMGLPYVYLGYFIRKCAKMNYKARFKPAEVLIQGRWRPLTDTDD